MKWRLVCYVLNNFRPNFMGSEWKDHMHISDDKKGSVYNPILTSI